jgi:hypothetical protein
VIGHVAGAPVEETVLPVIGGLGAGFVVAMTWLRSRLR